MNKIDRKAIGKNIRTERLSKGLTQRQLADIIGIDDTTLSNYENGTSCTSLEVFFILVQALETKAGIILGLEDY